MDPEDLEIELLLEAIYRQYHYDFRQYSRASIKRRILHRLAQESDLKSISEMQHQVLKNPHFLETLLLDFSINVTEMFRDPPFYQALRTEIVPYLKTYPFIRVWIAGCSTGEEVYSVAILFHEEGLGKKTQIYATDINEPVIKEAQEGIYPVSRMKEYTLNYQKSGSRKSFADYYTARYNSVIMNSALKSNIVFSVHNLVSDAVFQEMHLILCRNVLIYFEKSLQNRVLTLFRESLCHRGFLGLGAKESLRFSEVADDFEPLAPHKKIYQRR